MYPPSQENNVITNAYMSVNAIFLLIFLNQTISETEVLYSLQQLKNKKLL